MNLKPIVISIACLVVGLLVGRLLPGAPPPSRDDSTQVIETRHARSESSPPHSQDFQVAGGRGATKGPSATATPANPESDAMISVPRDLITSLSLAAGPRKIDQDLFSGDGAVEEALEITDHEKAVIQTAWRASLRKIREIEAASIRSEPIDEWSQRITLPDLSASISSLGSGFSSRIHGALGEDRGEAFLAAKQVDHMFAGPTGERAYSVTTEEVGDGRWRFRIEFEGEEGRRMWVGEDIPAELRHLTDAAGISPAFDE